MKINARQGGFTLVEIMIVVAIIALLASIAVPNFIRARQRSQATVVKNEMRMISSAIDQYAIDYNKINTSAVGWNDIKAYIKEGTALYNSGGTDTLGGALNFTTIAAGIKVPAATKTALAGTVETDFWSPYQTE